MTLLHVRGIPVRAHWTLLLVIPYLSFVLSVQFADFARLADVEHQDVALGPVTWGVILSLSLFASVAIHEAAHSLVALRFGGRVRSITLMLLGGVSQVTRLPRRPAYEAWMAFAGPAVSFGLGILFVGISRLSIEPADVRLGLFYLGSMNVALGAFNLVPAFPMDGGRVLRAILASRWGSQRATSIAARVGQVVAVFMGLLGIAAGNILLLLIAIFVYVGAGAEVAGERMRAALEGLQIADLVPVLWRPPAVIAATESVSGALRRMNESGRLELIVIGHDNRPAGVLQVSDFSAIRPSDRDDLSAGELAARFGPRHLLAQPHEDARAVLERASEEGTPFVIVVDSAAPPNNMVGLIAPSDIERAVALRATSADSRKGTPVPGWPSRFSARGMHHRARR